MSRPAYYNEFDPFAAAWLRELIAEGCIAPGDVDERSIVDVHPDDLLGYAQCHFFAGIGGWSLALRLAGWEDERPVWTGSCPCQPFSVAGKSGGVGDERHLWPAFLRLIAERRPATVFGEQVASADGRLWLAGVRVDLEGVGYAVGAADLCAAGVGAPHIRQRLYWVADAQYAERRAFNESREDGRDGQDARRTEAHGEPRACREVCGLADGLGGGRGEGRLCESMGRMDGNGSHDAMPSPQCGPYGGVGHADGGRLEVGAERDGEPEPDAADGHPRRTDADGSGFWSGAYWHPCRDGRYRRVPSEPSLFPLADGIPARVGLLRGAGNAIVPQVAAEFVAAFEEATR